MSLRSDRVIFTQLIPMLILKAEDLGFESALDFVKRCEDCKVGRTKSLHKQGVAADLHLYRGGVYLASTETHRGLGMFWETLHPRARWGGRYGDGNHYELVPEGE